jgi:hypothetical protein
LAKVGGPGTLHHVLAEGRHAPEARSIKPAYLVAGGVVALAAIVGVLILLTGGSASPIIGGSKSEQPTPGFQFKVEKTHVITTGPATTQDPNAKPDSAKAAKAAGPAADSAKAVLHTYYTQAFLAPANWTNGTYDSAFAPFAGQAKSQAQQHLAVLTAGTSAADTYRAIQPSKATIKTRVLVDGKNQPFSVACTIFFDANATKKSGSGKVVLQSQGKFILQKVGSSWKITSFTITRSDQVTASGPSAPATASGSPS